jgi:hypothetical protein
MTSSSLWEVLWLLHNENWFMQHRDWDWDWWSAFLLTGYKSRGVWPSQNLLGSRPIWDQSTIHIEFRLRNRPRGGVRQCELGPVLHIVICEWHNEVVRCACHVAWYCSLRIGLIEYDEGLEVIGVSSSYDADRKCSNCSCLLDPRRHLLWHSSKPSVEMQIDDGDSIRCCKRQQ